MLLSSIATAFHSVKGSSIYRSLFTPPTTGLLHISGFTLAVLLVFATNLPVLAQKPEAGTWSYTLHLQLTDTLLQVDVAINLPANHNSSTWMLFNRHIGLHDVTLNGAPAGFHRAGDTLVVDTPADEATTLQMNYTFHRSEAGSWSDGAANAGNPAVAPAESNNTQIFLERFHKWYPVVYNNFAEYLISVVVPSTHVVYGWHRETGRDKAGDNTVYRYHCTDEDVPLFITRGDIFEAARQVDHNGTHFEFRFLPRDKRLLAVSDNKPVYATNPAQIDSLLQSTTTNALLAFDWFQANLWFQETDTVRVVESSIFGLAVGMKNCIVIDRSLMSMEALDGYALSHELGHLWIGIHTLYQAKGKFFLGESVNEYVNLLSYKSRAGSAAFEQAIRNKAELRYSEKPFFKARFDQVLNQGRGEGQFELIYNKGVVFMHEFCNRIGQQKLLSIIKGTYSRPNHFVTLSDLENQIRQHGCWDQYLELFGLEL